MSTAQVERNLKQIGGHAKLAEELGLHRTHIYCVFSGKRTPSLDVFFKIADKLHVDPESLYRFLTNASTN